jgi:alkanesulfonate monooxygenase SsuD/methylene tetrahydromethanopterin reductase-like flavin-dependent oxidoreductase (luciferase family)
VFATFLQPHEKVRALFDAYRSAYLDQGLPGGGGTAFMPLVFTGETEEAAEAGARELIWYMTAKTEPQFRNPPGYVPVELNVKALQGAFSGRTDAMRAMGLEFQREQGVVMYGTPDQVAKQVRRFYDRVGGFDHLLVMQQAGFLDHARTVRSMTLFAKEVLPQIRDLARTRPNNAKGAAE